MCCVCAIYDYGRENNLQFSQDSYKLFLELLEAAKKLDTVTGQPDCEDPNKAKWLQEAKPEGVENV